MRAAVAGLALVMPLSAAAADKPLWEAGAGIGGLSLPHYRGSAQSHAWLLPVPYFVYRGAILRSDRDGTRAVLLDSDRVDFDISLAASAPADSGDDPARAGMPDLAPTLEIGPKLNVNLVHAATWKIDFRMPLRWGTTLERSPRSIGWSLTPVLNLDWKAPWIDVGVQAGPLWGDRRQNAYFYDVAPEYATVARPAYRSAGGYAGWQATVGVSRRYGDFWLGAYARQDSVAGAVFESSPLVTSRRQWSFGFATSWVFAASPQRVSVED